MTWAWTDDTTTEAFRLYVTLGWGATAVAAAIGAPSRNAIIGKAHRLGWMAKRAPGVGYRQEAGKRTTGLRNNIRKIPKPRAPPPPPEPAMPDTEPRHWMTRKTAECWWPIGEGADLLSCCAPVSRSGLCRAHVRVGYQRPKPHTYRDRNWQLGKSKAFAA